MTTSITLLLLSSLLAPVPADAPGVELVYKGTLTHQPRQGQESVVKEFDLYALVYGNSDQYRVGFLVDEVGGGGWPWPERFGLINLNAELKPQSETGIRLLHEYDEIPHPIALPFPVFASAEQLKEGENWVDGKLRYTVTESRKVNGVTCWEIEAENNFGPIKTLFVEQNTGLLVKAVERVFMGQGERFELVVNLDKQAPVEQEKLNKSTQVLDQLAELQVSLQRIKFEQQSRPELTEDQLKLAAEKLPTLETLAEDTIFDSLVATAANNVERQQIQREGIEGLAKRFVGKQVPEFQLKTLDGQPIDPKEYEGKIVVLHFWSYRNEKLREPYGQAGYLDFLQNQSSRRKFNVKVYGVAVNPLFADQTQAPRVIRSAKAFKEFFNLSYDITRDDGALVQKFGDPRQLNEELPLWVVIGPDGTIAHYSVGLYEINPNEGLKQLEAVIADLVRTQRAE